MASLIDIKVFTTNLIRFVFIFNQINMKSFFEISLVHFSLFSTLSPLKSRWKVHFFCSLGIYVKLFHIRQYFDEVAGWNIRYITVYKAKMWKGHFVFQSALVLCNFSTFMDCNFLTSLQTKLKLNKMLNIKTKFDTFQILGKEEFSKRTNIRSAEGCDHAKVFTKSISWPLIKFMLFSSIHKINGHYWKYWREILGQKTERCNFLLLVLFVIWGVGQYRPVCANIVSIFGFCYTLIFNVTFQEKYFRKNNLLRRKNLPTSQELFFSILSLLALFQG